MMPYVIYKDTIAVAESTTLRSVPSHVPNWFAAMADETSIRSHKKLSALHINSFSYEPVSFHLLHKLGTCMLFLVGQGVLGPVGELVVEVDERALDLWQALQLLLQGLADVVSLPQRHVRRQHDVHLHEVVGTKRVGAHCVDMPHGLVVVPAQVSQLLEVLRRGRLPHQGVHVLQHRHRPCSDRVDCQLQGRTTVNSEDNHGERVFLASCKCKVLPQNNES